MTELDRSAIKREFQGIAKFCFGVDFAALWCCFPCDRRIVEP
jgi:hypothetical protein